MPKFVDKVIVSGSSYGDIGDIYCTVRGRFPTCTLPFSGPYSAGAFISVLEEDGYEVEYIEEPRRLPGGRPPGGRLLEPVSARQMYVMERMGTEALVLERLALEETPPGYVLVREDLKDWEKTDLAKRDAGTFTGPEALKDAHLEAQRLLKDINEGNNGRPRFTYTRAVFYDYSMVEPTTDSPAIREMLRKAPVTKLSHPLSLTSDGEIEKLPPDERDELKRCLHEMKYPGIDWTDLDEL